MENLKYMLAIKNKVKYKQPFDLGCTAMRVEVVQKDVGVKENGAKM